MTQEAQQVVTPLAALKLALEALKRATNYDPVIARAITAIKEALAQTDQPAQPVAFEEWLANQHGDPEEVGFLQALRISYIAGQDSITTPPQRTWVGLTEEEELQLAGMMDKSRHWLVAEVEAKLKQKNGYAEENT